MYRQRLLHHGASEQTLDEIDAQAHASVETATEEAKAGAMPGADLLMKDVWADGGSSWRN
jgi:pyruvate dehydrogenase E1 component alpha subunit